MEKRLTLEQNLCSARIFLNTFGLILEDISEVNSLSELKIFDGEMNEVGKLYFKDDEIIMEANYNNSLLKANYKLSKMSGFVDLESGGALFGDWSSNINFSINSDLNLDGEFLTNASMDSEFGPKCSIHTTLNFKALDDTNVTLNMLRDGSTFNLEINKENYNEIIDVKPWDFIRHDIKIGKYDNNKYAYPYRKYAGIFVNSTDNENLHVFLKEEEYDNLLYYQDEYVPKEGKSNSIEAYTQKGLLMQKLDSSMFERIEHLRKILLIGDISLLDNLISVCLGSYPEEEINALLGTKIEKMNYQNGADNLTNAYFGIANDKTFLPGGTTKILSKK